MDQGFSNPLTDYEGYGAGGAAGGEAVKQGYLTKQGHVVKNWKRRWFVLRDGCLYYYKEDRTSQRGFIPLDNITISLITNIGKEHCFGLFHPQRPPYYIFADSSTDVLQWLKAIRGDDRVGLLDFDVISGPSTPPPPGPTRLAISDRSDAASLCSAAG